MGKVLEAKVHQANGVTQDVVYQPFTFMSQFRIPNQCFLWTTFTKECWWIGNRIEPLYQWNHLDRETKSPVTPGKDEWTRWYRNNSKVSWADGVDKRSGFHTRIVRQIQRQPNDPVQEKFQKWFFETVKKWGGFHFPSKWTPASLYILQYNKSNPIGF